MRLVRYELGKIWNHSLMKILLLLFLAVNLPIFLWQTTNVRDTVSSAGDMYDTLEARYRQMPLQEAYEELCELKSENDFIEGIKLVQRDGNEEILASVTQENPELFARYLRMQEKGTLPKPSEVAAIEELYCQIAYIHDYPDYIEDIRRQADFMNTVSIFQKPREFSYRNIIRTPEDFADNKNLELSLGRSEGIESLSVFFITDVFVIILLLVAAVRLFWEEKEKGLLVLVKSTANGRLKTVIAKIAALFIATIALTGVFYGMNFIAAKILFGFGDTSRVIQSMQEFGQSNVIITVREYLGVFWLGKMGMAFVLAMLFAAVLSSFRNNAIALMSIVGIFGVSYLAYRFIPNLSPFNLLKYLNPVAALNIMNLIAEYHNINLFGYPCNRVISVCVTMGVLLAVSLAVTIGRYVSKREHAGRFVWLEKMVLAVRRFMDNFSGVGLLRQEFHKLAFNRRMILLPILLILLCNRMVMKSEPVYSFDDAVYNSYLSQLEGELTEEKKVFLREEQERFDNVQLEQERIAQLYEEGVITKNKFDYEIFLLNSFWNRRDGFSKVMEQYEKMSELEERGIRMGFVNEISSKYLLDESERDAALGLIWLLLVVSVTAVCICQEYRHGMIRIMNPTVNGKRKLYRCKASAAMLFALSFMMICIPTYINQSRYYSMGDWSLPIQNIVIFKQIPIVMSIRSFVILSGCARLVAIVAILFLTILFSVRLQNQIAAIIASFVAGAFTLILYLFGVDGAKYLPYANAFLWNESMRTAGGFAASLINVLLIVILLVLCSIISYRKFCNSPSKKTISHTMKKEGGVDHAS